MSTFRVIALDLDGSLLDEQKHILPQSLTALEQAGRRGVKVILVTGRHHTAIRPFYETLDLDTPVICCNGAYLYDYQNDRIINGSPLMPQQIDDFFTLAQRNDMDGLVVYTDRAIVYETLNLNINRTQIWVDRLPKRLQPDLVRTDDLRKSARQSESVWKIITTHLQPEKLKAFGELLKNELAISGEWLSENTLEIVQKGCSKGSALTTWVERQGLSLCDVIAFGDNFNDISMFDVVGLSVAMGNSPDAVKKQADLVTLPNHQPGIADVINRYILTV